jgi:secreted PhoX family phosphatase
MTQISRRSLLKGAATAAGATVLGGPFQGLVARAARAAPPEFGVLGPVGDLRDGKVRLHLPAGFNYRSFHDTDGPTIVLDDDSLLTGRHDGMAAFPGPDGNVWLVRNHEHNGSAINGALGGSGAPYDSSALGGTTTTLVTPMGEVLQAFTSLNGTQMNCAGGPMPWGSWITCEETVNGPDVFDDFTRNIPNPSPPGTYIQNARLTDAHGFIFEVPAGGQSDRQPITKAGRFAHEAAAFDPGEGVLYLTEDNFGFPSGFYRYVPATDPMETSELDNDGQLQMLAVNGMPNIDLAETQQAGAMYDVEWVDIADPAPTFPLTAGIPEMTNDEALVYVGDQGRAQGAAYFSRLEGCVYDRGVVYFTATQGGGPAEISFGPIADGYGNGTGQVWGYRIADQTLHLIFEASGPMVLDLPDNVTTSARGTLVLCEDGPIDNYIRGLTTEGDLFNIALNQLRRNAPPNAARFGEEFAGSTFFGNTLFVNIQAAQGITFAIWGPWGRIGV